jgi:hypothetical protein
VAELVVLQRWAEFHRSALGFTPSWDLKVEVDAARRGMLPNEQAICE